MIIYYRVMKMNKFEKLMELENLELFKLLTGVTKELFELMLNVLMNEYDKIHQVKGGCL